VMMYLWTILPIFFAQFAFHRRDDIQKQNLFNFGQIVSALPMFIVGVMLYFYGDVLLSYLNKNSTASELTSMFYILRILALCIVMHGFSAIFSNILTATGYEKEVGLIILMSIVVSVVLNYLTIPIYGAMASAWVTLFNLAILSLGYLYILYRNTSIRIDSMIFFKLLGFLVALFAITYFISQAGYSYPYAIAALVVFSCAFILLSGFYRVLLKKEV
jgi:O-antigen/teichoic acid export membrane protein